jgi:hypothetical protein
MYFISIIPKGILTKCNLTAHRPITELAPVRRERQQQNITNKIKNCRIYVVITIIITLESNILLRVKKSRRM